MRLGWAWLCTGLRPSHAPEPMPNFALPHAAAPSALPTTIRLAVASSSVRPPEGDDWLHEIKYDGHRIVAVLDGRGGLRLITRNGYDRTPLFRVPFRDLLACGREIVLDGEIAVPDGRGVTHIGHLQDALDGRIGWLFRVRSAAPRRPRSAPLPDRGAQADVATAAR